MAARHAVMRSGFDLRGQRILITGAASGIGAATARVCASLGAAPGAIETPMTRGQPIDPALIPLGRKGEAEEVAWPVAFLCSPAASYITGALLDINGGLYMS